ncbi:hypothetical protein C1646_692341 [Rhizophagus diaphanus]|nr:hypothetical protein C1646_692341 [Rhizophagus diaphanus] [Rhizophagus sp. MUCL 43196]
MLQEKSKIYIITCFKMDKKNSLLKDIFPYHLKHYGTYIYYNNKLINSVENYLVSQKYTYSKVFPTKN